jgi:hypothetical protein
VTVIEQRAAKLLPEIRYATETWHEPRAKTLFRLCNSDPLWSLTALQQEDLWFLIWHYRRQVADAEVVARADEFRNGALSLRF